MGTTWRTAAVAWGATVGLVGCGGGELSHDELVAAVTERCATVNAQLAEAEETFGGETPEDAVGYLGAIEEAMTTFADEVDDLDAPEEDRATVDALTDAIGSMAAGAGAAASEVEAGTPPEEAFGAVFATYGDAQAAASELGVGSLDACGEEEVVADPDAAQVEVVATEYAFDLPASLEAGPTAFTMRNEGEEPHYLEVVRLTDDVSLEDALGSEDPEGDGLIEIVGESATAGPGDAVVLNVEDLDAGRYAVACFIPSPDGEPHAFLGMVEEFEVE